MIASLEARHLHVRSARATLSGLAFLVLAAVAGCQNGDAVRAALAAQESSWQGQLAGMEQQRLALNDRCQRQGASGGPALGRVRTTLTGLGQSIVDVKIQMQQVRPRVEAVIAEGTGDANKALEDERSNMDGYLRALASDVTSVAGQLDSVAQGQRSAAQQPN